MSNTVTPVVVDRINGASFPAFQAAVPVFLARGLELQHYRMSLMEEGAQATVIFTDVLADPNARTRGSPGQRPGFAVEVDRRTLRILNAYFMR